MAAGVRAPRPARSAPTGRGETAALRPSQSTGRSDPPPIAILIASGRLTNGNCLVAPPVTRALLWQRPIRGLSELCGARPFRPRSRGAAAAPRDSALLAAGGGGGRGAAGRGLHSRGNRGECLFSLLPLVGTAWERFGAFPVGGASAPPAGVASCGLPRASRKVRGCVVFHGSEAGICQKYFARQLSKEHKLKPGSSMMLMASCVAIMLLTY